MKVRSAGIFGSTGSIGVSTLELLEHTRETSGVEVSVLTAGRNVQRLVEQCKTWRPQRAVIADDACYHELKSGLAGTGVEASRGSAASAAPKATAAASSSQEDRRFIGSCPAGRRRARARSARPTARPGRGPPAPAPSGCA